jgi:hypothetical protein
MERCCGVELQKVWGDIPDRQKAAVLQKVVSYEVAFAKSSFPMYGSLYYASDLTTAQTEQYLNTDLSPMKDRRPAMFAVGPTTNREFFDHGRADVSAYRGPCEYDSFVRQ